MHAGNSWNLAVAGLLMFTAEAQAIEFYEPVRPPRAFQVMAHGGMSRQAPENTRPALERALQDGIEWAEVDVRRTKDGRHVLLADARVDEKTDGRGAVNELTLEQLQELDAGGWFAPRHARQRVLSLRDCLELAREKLNLCLDCKDVDPSRLAEEILEADMARQVLVLADLQTLVEVREKSNGRIPIMTEWRSELGLGDWIARWRPDAVTIDADEITPEACQALHAANIKVRARVLGPNDRPEVWDRVLEAGADLLQTDLPEDVLAHRFWKKLASRPVQLACHRGANRYAPENTLAAFEKAIRLGADFVEIDIRRSSDGQFFILHDGSLGRTTDAAGPISATSAAGIRQLDAGSKFGRPFRSERVPTLDEALDLLAGRAGLYIDAKDIPPEDLARLLTRRKLLDHSVVYQSPSYLERLRELAPGVRGLCPLDKADQVEKLADTVKPYGFDVAWRILSKDLIDRCHARNIKVFSDALGAHERIEDYLRAIDWGIDVIQTDHPLRVIRAVELRISEEG